MFHQFIESHPLIRTLLCVFREDAGTNVLLLRTADGYLDALLNPAKRNAEAELPRI